MPDTPKKSRRPPKGTKAKIFHMKPHHWQALDRISFYFNKNNHDTLRYMIESYDAQIARTLGISLNTPLPSEPTYNNEQDSPPEVVDSSEEDEEFDLNFNPWVL